METLVAVGVAVAIAVVAFVAAHLREKRRIEAWGRAGEALGLDPFGQANDLLTRFGHLKVFQAGRRRQITHGIGGDAGNLEIAVADYQYVVGSGKNARTVKQTVCILRGEVDLPEVHLRPEGRIGNFFGKLFGLQDIDFDEDAEFSRAYVLQGPDEAALRGLFTPERRAWFAAQRGKNLHFEAQGKVLLFHHARRVPPETTRALMAQAIEIHRLLTD